jgi:hypothetical protein
MYEFRSGGKVHCFPALGAVEYLQAAFIGTGPSRRFVEVK